MSLIEQGLTSPSTQYRLYGRRFLQVKRLHQQYQSTEGTQRLHNLHKNTIRTHKHKNTANPPVDTNMG